MATLKRISVETTMSKPMQGRGPTEFMTLPCVAYAHYIVETGSLHFETVICDGEQYSMLELQEDDLAKIQALLELKLKEDRINEFYD